MIFYEINLILIKPVFALKGDSKYKLISTIDITILIEMVEINQMHFIIYKFHSFLIACVEYSCLQMLQRALLRGLTVGNWMDVKVSLEENHMLVRNLI